MKPTDDQFAGLRALADQCERQGHLWASVEVPVLRALLDAADERDKLANEYANAEYALQMRLDRIEAQRDRLAAALQDAIECVESWGAYASEYFQNKHDLAGDLARLRAALAELEKK